MVILGALFMLAERFHIVHSPGSSDFLTWHMIASGLCFATAGFLLIFYSEHKSEKHSGFYPLCHHGWPVTFGAAAYAAVYSCSLVVGACRRGDPAPKSSRTTRRTRPAKYTKLEHVKEQLEAELEMKSLVHAQSREQSALDADLNHEQC